METIFVKPARAGDLIRDPVSKQPLAPEGEAKPRNSTWVRRLLRREVVETTAEEIAAALAAKAKAEAEAQAAAEAQAPTDAAASTAEGETTTKAGKARKGE